MSNLDEARYGRACLLILNICPFALRQVISYYYIRQGSLSIQDFLEKKKHDLFHLMRKRCCCRAQQSSITPMNNSQWDSLYMKISSSCRVGQRGDCPCQYNAKPGITTSVMDITLCCLFIKNICHGITINMTNVDTIREVRNNLIHAGSASLDEPTFRNYWNIAENAIIDIAFHVSPTLHSDITKRVKDLENQSMNTAELAEQLKRLIVDEKRIYDLEKNVHDITDDLTRMSFSVNQTTQKVTEIEENVQQSTRNIKEVRGDLSLLQTAVVDQERETRGLQQRQIIPMQQDLLGHAERIDANTRQIDEHGRQQTRIQQEIADIKRHKSIMKIPSKIVKFIRSIFHWFRYQIDDTSKLKQTLIKINHNIAKLIPISPFQERGDDEMPIELLYASVVIREDRKLLEKGRDSSQHTDEGTDLSESYYEFESDSNSGDYEYTSDSGSDDNNFITYSQHGSGVTNPARIFIQDDNIVENIYMLGDAAHGKTTYCIWLLKKWCDAQQADGEGSKEIDKWETLLKRFDFVFLLQFRYVNPSTASVIDMICQDVFRKKEDFHATIRHVLSSDKFRSLIIMDGLDEWNPNEDTTNQLMCKGLPNTEGMASSVSCFISMRPWVFPTILKIVNACDRVIEIHGLSETGMKKVIENVLFHHYKLKDDSSKYKATYTKIVRHLKKKSIKSFMQIPLLAVVCVQIWYEGKQVGDSMTSFYAVMLNMLIERAHQKHKLPTEHSKTVDCELPEILSENEYIKDFISVLLKLGKVAYKGLLSNKTSLEFQKRKLEKEIGERELQFALDVGLISQKEAPSLTTKNVSVHFFHKSIQEFLAVIYIVTQKEIRESFCKHLSNVKVIMEFSNVIMFVCGMCPSLGSIISQHVVSVTDSDTDLCKYRESPGHNNTVEELYRIQVSLYREIHYGHTYYPVSQKDIPATQTNSQITQKDSPVTQTDIPLLQTDIPVTQTNSPVTQKDSPLTQKISPVTFPVLDVYLRDERDTETVRGTRELLSGHHVDIRSFYLQWIPSDGERGITNTLLDDFLSDTHNTRSLVTLCIYGGKTYRSIPTLCAPKLRCLQLAYVTINTHLCGSVCPPLLTDMSQLRVLMLENVTLGEGGLGLSPDMVHIERISLTRVTLGEGGLGLSPDMVHIEKIKLCRVTLGEGGLGLSPAMVNIKRIKLWYVKLGEGGLRLSPNMVHIEKVDLKFVDMPAAGWEEFVLSVSNIQHNFNVVLGYTEFDDVPEREIQSSPNFIVRLVGVAGFASKKLLFDRVWPPSQLAQNDEKLTE